MKNKKRFMIVLMALCLAAVTLVQTAPAAPPCGEERCVCFERTTVTFTRVGATCAKAQQRAVDAALATAVCNPGDTSCGPTSYFFSSCSTNHLGQLQASAFARYHCEVCVEPPDCDPPF